ncbi:hypothetical protein BKA70DRAFT_1285667 [Coprinopsis sp. MPI-PUGE-AT-0042]|nr:hypothetical protein BKA70DRAFT_1285667 [Coprinopsis sp. MPI-PUGE-AT-0042]
MASDELKLPKSFLQKIAAWDLQALAAFRGKFNNEHYSLDVLDALLSVFRKDARSPALTFDERVLGGPQTLECLEKVLRASHDHPNLLEATRSRMRAAADDLASWMESSIWTCYQYLDEPAILERRLAGIASAIVACLGLKGAFVDEFIQHPVLIRTLLTLWSSVHVSDPTRIVTGVQETGTSSILLALKHVVGHQTGSQAAAEFLIHHPHNLAKFCRATPARFVQIPPFINTTRAEFDLATAKKHLFTDTCEVVSVLSRYPVIQKALLRAGYLGSWMATLVALAPAFSPDTLLATAAHVFDQCVEEGTHPSRNLRALFDHGYLTLISDALIRYDISTLDKESGAVHAMSRLEPFTYYPRVVKSLWNGVNRISLERLIAVADLPFVGKRWHHLIITAGKRIGELEKSEPPVVFCDNNTHHDWSVKRPLKSCSDCHMVVYCSKECQRQDWKNRHRDECNAMRLTYLDRCKSRIHFSHKTLAFPLKSLEILIMAAFQIVKPHMDSLEGEKLVAIMSLYNSMFGTAPHFDTLTVENYLTHFSPGDCIQIDHRMKTMIADFVANPSKDLCLWELRLAWTKHTLLVLFAEVDMTPGRIKVMRSLVQIRHPGPSSAIAS